MKFRITWSTGKVTEEESETLSPDAYAMERWGQNSAADVEREFGVKLELIGADPVKPSDAEMKASEIAKNKAAAAAQ